jgi:lysophospholipid acyltransferase (LPLAT)-like uncharacterized protein
LLKTTRLKLKQRWLPYVYGKVGKWLFHILASTCRFQFEGLDLFIRTATKQKCVLIFWHNRLAMIAEILSRHASQFRYAAVISNSRDGEMIAVLTNSYQQARSIRVSHHARYKALQMIIQELKKGPEILLVTPDGPRGPLYEVKAGVVIAARESEAQVIPLSWKASSFWKLPTWDSFMIPKPFSTIHVKIGTPIQISKEIQEVAIGTKMLQKALTDLDSF